MTDSSARQRVQEFLDSLTELTRRTGIVVSGCGHCDSPRLLVDGKPWPWNPEGSYVADYKPDACVDENRFHFGQVRWHDSSLGGNDQREPLEDAPSLLPARGHPVDAANREDAELLDFADAALDEAAKLGDWT